MSYKSLFSTRSFSTIIIVFFFQFLSIGLAAQTIGGTGSNDDFDGDGIINSIDLDDDNDGIVDTEECSTSAKKILFAGTSEDYATMRSSLYAEFNNNKPNGANIVQSNIIESATVPAGFYDGYDIVIFGGAAFNTIHANHWAALQTAIRNKTSKAFIIQADNCCVAANQSGLMNLLNGVFGTNYALSTIHPIGNESYTLNPNSSYASVFTTNTISGANYYPIRNVAASDVLFYSASNPTLALAGMKQLPGTTERNRFVAWFVDGTITQGAPWYTTNQNKIADAFFDAYNASSTMNCDTDVDGVPNHFDLDSDGDRCPDALEAGVSTTILTSGTVVNLIGSTIISGTTTSTLSNAVVNTVSSASGTFGNNGFANVLETTSESGLYSGIYNYQFAISKNYAACADLDQDNINDIIDIDDDNDGVLDAIESPACFFTAEGIGLGATDRTGILKLTSDLTLNSVSRPLTNMIDNPLGTTILYTDFLNAQTAVNKNIVTVEFPRSVKLSEFTFNYNSSSTIFGASSSATLRGSNDGINWIDLVTKSLNSTVETGNITKFTISTNADKYKYYRVYSTAGTLVSAGQLKDISFSAPTYNASEYPALACEVDDDEDGIFNHQDLDSDGDGCNDASEAIVTLFNTTVPLTGNFGSNGFLNTLETGTDSGIYSGTYSYSYAKLAYIKACLDTDGDLVPDIIDIDDDNDGVTDIEEGNFCLPSGTIYIGPTYFKSVTAQNLTVIGTTATPLSDMTDGNISKGVSGNFNWTSQSAPIVIDINLNFPVIADGFFIANDNGVVGDGIKNANIKLYNQSNQLIAQQSFNPLLNGSTGAGNELYDKYAFSKSYVGVKRMVLEVAYSGITTGAATPNYQIREIGMYRDDSYCTERDTDLDGTPDQLDADSDNDGCNDAYESGAVSSNLTTVSGTYGVNGLSSLVETSDLVSAITNYASSYNFLATQVRYNKCTDSDNDGIVDLDDIDDDNDGILDLTESPSCFFKLEDWNTKDKSNFALISSDLATTTNVFTSSLLTDNLATDASSITFSTSTTQSQIGKAIYKVNFFKPVKLNAWYIQKVSATQIFANTASSLMVQGSNDNTTWTNLLTSAIASPADATNTVANGAITLPNSNKFTINANPGFYKYYRIFGVGSTAANILGGSAEEFFFDINPSSYNAGFFPTASCTTDTDGDGIPNHRDLDSDGDACPDAKESGVNGSLTFGSLVNLLTINAAPGSATSTTNNVASAVASSTYGANGFADGLETATESGLYSGTYFYEYAINKNISGCTDSDGDGVNDVLDLDDDNDGILDLQEQISCYTYGVNLDNITFNGNAVISKTSNSITTSSPAWISSYSMENFSLPLSLKFNRLSTDGTAMFGLLPAGNAQTPSNYNDLGHKFNIALAQAYGYFNGGVWSFSHGAVTGSEEYSIDISSTGYVTVKINGVQKQAYQGTASDYKLVVSAGSSSMLISNIRLTNAFNPEKTFCFDRDTDGDGTPNRLDLDSDDDGCSDAFEAGTTSDRTQNFTYPDSGVGTNGFTNALETSVDNGIYSGTYTILNVFDRYKKACIDTDGDNVSDLIDLDDDNDGVLDSEECQAPVFDNWIDLANFKSKLMSSAFHGTLFRSAKGNYYVAGQYAKPDGTDQTTPTLVTPANGYNYTGEIIDIAAVGSNSSYAIATTKGIWVWGYLSTNFILPGTSSTGASPMQQVTLPTEIDPKNIKSISASTNNFMILMQDGTVFTYGMSNANINGAGLSAISKGFTKVLVSANTPLTNISQIEATSGGSFAADATNNKLYTWGANVYLGNSTATTTKNYATEMTNPLPNGTSIVMIDATYNSGMSYLLLGSDRKVYSMGLGVAGILGQNSTTNSTSWLNVKGKDGVGILQNVQYLSAQNSTDGYTSASVILTNGQPLSWGDAGGNNMIGLGNSSTLVPKTPDGITDADIIYVIENGGHLTPMLNDKGEIGNVGHNVAGAFADGSSASRSIYVFNTFERGSDFSDNIAASCNPDIDGDGIPNRLDLDTDGDGCSDAKEAGVKGTLLSGSIQNKVNGSLITTSVNNALAQGTYGNNGFANLLETSSESGAYSGTYTYDFATDGAVSACADADSDGVSDINDLDDDNDGVLDTKECPSLAAYSLYTYNYPASSIASNVPVSVIGRSTQNVILDQRTNGSFSYNTINNWKLVATNIRPTAANTIKVKIAPTASTAATYVFADAMLITNGVNTYIIDNNSTNTDGFLIQGAWSQQNVSNAYLGTNSYLTSPAYAGNTASWTFSNIATPTLCDTDGDGIANNLDLDSDGDGCPDAREANVKGTLTSGNVVNLVNYNAGAGTATSTTINVANAIANGTYGSNGFADALETSTESGVYSFSYAYRIATNRALNGCLDSDNDNVSNVLDLDDDNDGILDTDESINCIATGIDLNSLVMSGVAITSKTSNSFSTAGGDVWKSSYSNDNLKLPISLKFKNNSTTGYSMFGLIPAASTQTPTTWTDGGYKFYPQNSLLYGYFTSTWDPDGIALSKTDILGIDISTTGYVTVTVNGINKKSFQGTLSDYKLVVSSYRVTTLSEIILSDASNPLQYNCTDLDTDVDGVPNSLDLDSDGDGCPDAKEAGVKGTLSSDSVINNVNGNNITTTIASAIATGTYGDNGFANSIETSTESGLYTGTYTYFFATDAAVSVCLDTDADGVTDMIDLDDDNDGVLDTVECPLTNILVNGTFAGNSNGWTANANWVWKTGDFVWNSADNVSNNLISQTFAKPIFNAESSNVDIAFDVNTNGTGWSITSSGTATLDVILNNTTYATITNPNGGTTASVVAKNGAIVNVSSINIVTTNVPYTKIIVSVPRTVFTNSNTIGFNFGATVDDFGIDNVFIGTQVGTCDIDNDGIVNSKDLDSDGDGCSDASESKTVSSLTATTVNGTYGNNGFANSIETATESGMYSGTYLYSRATDPTIKACLDSDYDGIPDIDDVDDDNDGILDTNECVSALSQTFPTTGGNTNSLTSWTVGGTYASSGSWTSATGRINLNANGLEFRRDASTTSTITRSITNLPANSEITLGNLYWFNTNAADNSVVATLNVKLNGVTYATIKTGTANTAQPTITVSNGASSNLNLLPSTSANTTSAKSNLVIKLTNSNISSATLVFEFIASTSAGEVDDIGFASISINSCAADTDGDGIPNQLDLDSDGDGCSDANEAYGLTTAQGTDGNQYYGTNPITVDATGKIIGATYTATSLNVISVGAGSTITAQPTDQSINIGGAAVFATSITAGTGTTTYQWQVSADGGTTWNNITNSSTYTGAGTLTLTVANVPLSMKGYRYRLNISQSNYVCGNVTSSVARLLMDNTPIVVDDNATVTEDTPISGNVLTNDKGSGNPAATITVTNFTIGGVTYTAGQTATIAGVGTIIINANGSYTFTPTANYNGTVPAIDYTATDANGGSDIGTLNFTVTAVNDAPIAVDDNINTNQNIPVSGNVLTDDTDDYDADGNLLTVTEFKIGATTYNVGTTATIPGVGTIVVNSTGIYTFTPVFGYTGSVPAIDYTIGDGNGGSDIGRLSINVIDVNDAPLATDDIQTINQNTTATGNLLNNDADVDAGANLSVTQYSFTIGGTTYTNTTSAGVVTMPGVGTINITANGAYTFVPTGTFTGTVPPITYTLNDGTLTDNALLDIFVQPVNANPVASNDLMTTNEDTPVSGNVLTDGTDDSDADGNSLTVTEINFTVGGTTYTYPVGSTVNIPGVGTIIVNANGSYTFTPLSNYNGSVPTISYTISDGHGGTAIGNLNITILATNDNPIAVNDDNKVTPEDTPVTVNVLTNDSDPDGGGTVLTVTQFTIAGITGTFTSTAVIPGKGTLTALPNGDFTFTPDLNYNGVLPTITYTVSDGTATNTATLKITVTPVNDAPTVIVETITTSENTAVAGNVLTNDTDVETGTASNTISQFTIGGVTYTAGSIVDIPNVGTIIVNANGNYTFTPVLGYFGTVPAITYTVADPNGGVATGTLAITVTPVNDPPVVVSESVLIQEDTIATGNLLTNDTDPENNALTITQFTIAGLSGTFTASSTAIIPGVGTIIMNTNGSYTFTPTANYNGILPAITYTVSDGLGGLTNGNLNIVVAAVNDAPIVVNDSKSEPVNTPITGNVLTNDRDVEASTLTVTNITIAGVTYPVGQLTTITGVGTILMNADGTYTFTPALNYVGSLPAITYLVSDGTATSSGTLSLTITPIDADGDGIPDEIEKGNGSTPRDTDGDGTPDYLDLDSDGDGIPDNAEDSVCIGFMPCTPTDTDNDGTPDYRDLDSDGDGILDATEDVGCSGTLPCTPTDTDGDGTPNYRDLDSDGDGITDAIEKGSSSTPLDTDNDGTPNYLDLDSDGDGISDAIEKGSSSTPVDTDNDGTPDYLDVDSDGDGIPDSIEKGTGTTPIDTDGDGIPNYLDTDSDGDGILDNNEDNGCTGTAPCTPTDTDGDGTPDYLDVDSDNDGILDSEEKGSGTTPADTDGDGIPDFRDLDSDGDGIVDAIEKGTGSTLLDTDGDGIPNYLDVDSDNDGIPDNIEKGAGSSPIDTDSDGVPDYLDTDSDGDGIPDSIEDAGCTGTAPCTPTDTDGDGIPNYKDVDSDGDGISDTIEKGANSLLPVDTDGDGTPDYLDLDSDGDGISDAIEKGTGLTPLDTDGDGIPDYRDTDSDNDGISDAIEKGSTSTPVDTDGDGIPDYKDLDSDGDGKPDQSEGSIDTDGDGTPNFRDLDADGDGVLDAVDQCPLVDGLGSTSGCPPDSDGDGLIDATDADDDNDGILDTVEAAACSPINIDCDTDGDGIPNRLDKDSDGDGITDVIEAGGTDANMDGIADGTPDSNGVPSSANGGLTPPDTDGTGNSNSYDLDSDGDGISDAIEKGTGTTLADTDGDGTPDYLDVDSDGDGITDAIEKGTGTSVADTDSDGIPDFKDLDSDGDAIPDSVEKGSLTNPIDTDNDGVPNYRDSDSDGDGITDITEDVICTGSGTCSPTDTDSDGTPDYLDADSDGDGIPDTIEKGAGATPVDTDGDGNPDYLDLDSDGDGILDSVEDAVCTGTAPCTPTDTDGDGIPNFRDLDSDGDGISDNIEKGTGSTPVDSDSDVTPDYLDADSDGDGISDAIEKGSGTTPLDTDGDGTPDYLDLDSDGDGIPDSVEKGTTTSPVDTDSDGTPDFLDTDTDGDGIPDSVEDAACSGTACTPTDTDGDGIPNHKDLDSDGDGIPDSIEKGINGATPTDTDGTGNPDYLDTDSDGDGISDAVEKGIDGNNPLDTDGDGTPDYKDTDSDNDGIPDSIEKGTGATPLDTDGDGTPDYRDTDSDGDGILDNTEDAGCTGTAPCTPTDTDGDGIPNYRDLDSDGDNKTDLSEGETDYDGDGIPNYLDPDSDGDGINDNVDQCPLLPGIVGNNGCPIDTDGDGVYDINDSDDDNDGILDTVEAAACSPFAPDCDTDGDGIPNRLDPDSDNDGINDVIESNGTDVDGDGKVDGGVDANGVPTSSNGGVTPPNTDGATLTDPYDTDSDGDGISDLIEKGTNGNNPLDTDGDGIPDYRDTDADNDGIPDSVERGTGTSIVDTDGDGIPDYKDTDSDGDGILDATEDGGCTGTAPCTPTDTDGDGIPNYRDVDSDGDGIKDSIEKGTGSTLLDTDGDGTPNYLDTDSDGDGISDAIEKGLDPNNPIDTDGDGKPDYLDTDSDNDGIPDAVEKGTGTTPIDTDGDGVPDYRDTDSDGDGILDSIEDDSCTGTAPCTPTDTDGDGIPNYLDLDTDGDGKLDAVEKGPGATPMDSDRDGIPDYRDVDNLGNADVNVTNINTAVTGNLKTNDEVPVGSTYKQPAANANNPNGATLVVNSDGTYTFTGTTPGKYIYYVPVCGPNQTNGCPLTPLEITVLDPLNTDKPVANNDFATIAQGTPIALNVLANDKAGDEGKVINPSSLTVSNAPKHGTAVVNNDGTITYTPSPYFVGTDSIVYQVCDNNNPAQCQTAVAYFKIEATGVTPVTTAADDYISIVSSATGSNTVSGTVLLNDQNAGGGNLSATLISGPSTAQGTLVFNSDGSYSFTPAAGFVGPINIVYEVCGGSPVDCAKATLHILVNPPPTLVNDTASAYINIPIGGNISTNDIVPAGTTYGQPAQITGATITVGVNGTYTFTATAAGTYTYTVPVCAPGQTTNCPTETLVITVPVNNLVDDAATAYVNIPKSGNISTNDVVPPGTTYGQPAQLTGATITVGPNGTYTFTATTAGTYTYTVPVCAPGQTTNCPTETLVVTIPVNSLLNDTANAVVNIPTTGNISTNDVVPAGTTYGLPVANPSNPTGATISVGANGTYTFTATLAGTYTYTVPVCAPGQFTNCPTETLVIVVTNPAPPINNTINNPDFGVTNISVPLSGNLNTNDNISTGTTYGQPAANASNPTGAFITVNANGTYSFNATQPGTYTYYVPICAAGQTTGCPLSPLVITVVDPLSNTNAPIVNPDIATTIVNTPITTNVIANDKAANLGTSLNLSSLSIATAPKHGSVIVNADGTLTYTPANGFVGSDSLIYTICDNSTPTPICKSGVVYYTVNTATANAVTTAGDDFAKTYAGNPVAGNVLNNDKNTSGATLVVTANSTVPANKGVFLMNTNGTYTFTPAPGFTGPIEVTYTVCGGTPQVCTNATLHLLVEPLIPAKILEVTKIANSAKMNLDGSFNISFVLKIQNLTKDYIDSVLLKDDLSKVFTNTTGVKVSSVVVSGKLVKNNSYDGVQNIDLLSVQSALDPQKEDSVILNINVASSVSGNFLNTAIATAPTAYGLVSTISTDPTKLSSSTDTTRRPTQFMIPLIEVMIPPSFSPNSDGFNDAWIISRPAGTTITVKVFNRWGNEVYSSADYKNDWRGKGVNNILGEDLPEGTYYYVVETRDSNGTTRKFAGSLTLVR